MNGCHPGSLAEAVRDPGDWAKAVRFTWVPDKRCALSGMTTIGAPYSAGSSAGSNATIWAERARLKAGRASQRRT